MKNDFSNFFPRMSFFLVAYRTPLFVTMVLAILLGVFFSSNIRVDNSIELWFLENDPSLTSYRQFRDLYGNDEVIIAMLSFKENNLFNAQNLNKIWQTSKDIEADPNIRRVLSISLAPYMGLNGDTLIVEDIITKQLENDSEANVIKTRFLENPLWKKLLIDISQTHSILIIEPVAGLEMDIKRPEIINSVKLNLKGFDYRLAGMGVMYDELNQLSMRDGMLFTMLSYFILTALIFLLYRSYGLFLLVAIVMTLGSLCFLGVYGIFRQNFNMVSVALPTLMMILSISDVTYIFNNYCINVKKVHENREAGLIQIFSECLSPCLFTSLTNFFGFIAIVTSPMLVLRNFGAFAAFITLAEYVISVVTAAFILGFLKPNLNLTIQRPFANFVTRVMAFIPRYSKVIMVFFMIFLAIGIYGISILDVDTYSMGFLKPDNPVRKDSDTVEATYGYYLPLEVRFITPTDDGIIEPDFLRRLVKTHDDLEAMPDVQKAASIADVVRRLNQVWTDNQESSYIIPDSQIAVSQLLMLYESDPDNDLKYMTDTSYKEARLTIRIPMVSASLLRKIEAKVASLLEKNFANTNVKYIFGGYVPLYSRLLDYVTSSQISSFGFALIGVFGAMALLFRRKSALLLGVVPNVFPIIMTLGTMGILDIRLDIASVTIASIALGIAVDDTIHELFLFYQSTREKQDPVLAITECIIECGPAVMATSIIYSFGFCAFLFASIKSVTLFGGLLAITIIFGMICEITILPAMVCLFQKQLSSGHSERFAED